ncbi:MAG: EAL domain-containing protein [Methylobacter sp.]|nr:MAG: EAL domain-containing protein [Methylobacter sp.]
MTTEQKRTLSSARQDQYALHKNKVKTLKNLQSDQGKLRVFSTQLTSLIDTIPDANLFKDREGRKLITNKLTQRLFKRHDLDWYGKTHIMPRLTSQEIRAHARMLLESDLDIALAKRQFKLHYQVQVDGAGQIVGAEALLRWEHPRYGLIAPEQFIPVAEQSGLILPIGAWVLQSVCEQLKQWLNDPLKKDVPIAVNISPRQFSHPEFVEQLSRMLEENAIDATRLKLELTESLMLHDISNTIEKMKALQLLGIRFSMDNFGRGYSSLSQLRVLPIDQLKIDQFLIRDIVPDSCDAMLVKTVIDMSRKLGIGVIAEGVETEQQFTCLKQLGCSAYQGYLFGKPMPVNEFEKLASRLGIRTK